MNFRLSKFKICIITFTILGAIFYKAVSKSLFDADLDQAPRSSRISSDSIPTQRNSAQHTSKSVRTKHKGRTIASKPSDADILDEAHKLIFDTEFSPDAHEAESALLERLNYLSELPISHDREFLISSIIDKFSQSIVSSTKDIRVIEDRIQSLNNILIGKLDSLDLGKLKDTLINSISNSISKSSEKSAYLDSLEGDGVKSSIITEKLLATIFAIDLKGSESPEPSSIESLASPEARNTAARYFLENYDFATANKHTIASFADFYLNTREIQSGGVNLAINIFGATISKEPGLVSQLISEASPSQKRDEAIEQMIYRLATSDPERTKMWLNEITDEKIKARALVDIGGARLNGKLFIPEYVTPDSDPFK